MRRRAEELRRDLEAACAAEAAARQRSVASLAGKAAADQVRPTDTGRSASVRREQRFPALAVLNE